MVCQNHEDEKNSPEFFERMLAFLNQVGEPDSSSKTSLVFSCFRSDDLQHSPVSSLRRFDKREFFVNSLCFILTG